MVEAAVAGLAAEEWVRTFGVKMPAAVIPEEKLSPAAVATADDAAAALVLLGNCDRTWLLAATGSKLAFGK